MKMIYRERDNRRRRRKILITTSVVIGVIVFIVLANRFFAHFFTPVAQEAGAPMLRSRIVISESLGGLWDVLYSKRQLVAENTTLRQQLALFKAVQTERDSLSAENTTLRNLLGRKDLTVPTMLTQVLAKPGFSPYDTIIADAGSSEGVASGDPVLADQTIIVGEVASVTAHTSTITLYSSPDQKNDIFIGSTTIETIATGQGGGVFLVHLPKNAGVAIGDTVTLAKSPTKILGTVASIDNSPENSFEQILFTSPVDINQLNYLTIELTNKE